MCAVPNVAVFCSSFTSCFPGMLLTYFLNAFEIVPVAPIITVYYYYYYYYKFQEIRLGSFDGINLAQNGDK